MRPGADWSGLRIRCNADAEPAQTETPKLAEDAELALPRFFAVGNRPARGVGARIAIFETTKFSYAREAFVHFATLLPRHFALLAKAKSVTYVPGMMCYPSLGKHTARDQGLGGLVDRGPFPLLLRCSFLGHQGCDEPLVLGNRASGRRRTHCRA